MHKQSGLSSFPSCPFSPTLQVTPNGREIHVKCRCGLDYYVPKW